MNGVIGPNAETVAAKVARRVNTRDGSMYAPKAREEKGAADPRAAADDGRTGYGIAVGALAASRLLRFVSSLGATRKLVTVTA